MELRHLRYFLAVAEAGTVSRAAERMFVAQPSLSRQLHDLERHVGEPLFVRSHRGVALTAAGLRLLPRARAIVDQADDAVTAVRQSPVPRKRSFRIGVSRDTTSAVVPLLRAVSAARPDIELVRGGVDAELFRWVDDGEVDAAVVWWVDPDRELLSRCLFTESLVAVLPERDPLAAAAAVTVDELGAGTMVMFDRRYGSAAYDGLATALRGRANDPEITHTEYRPAPGLSGQGPMVELAWQRRMSTVITTRNWVSWLRRPAMTARPLTAVSAPCSLIWRRADDPAGPLLADALRALHAIREATIGPSAIEPLPAGG